MLCYLNNGRSNMADFCKQCVEYMFGGPREGITNDFIGLTTAEDTKKGLYTSVLCEGCGFIQVDHIGKCVTPDCPRHGKNGDQHEPKRKV